MQWRMPVVEHQNGGAKLSDLLSQPTRLGLRLHHAAYYLLIGRVELIGRLSGNALMELNYLLAIRHLILSLIGTGRPAYRCSATRSRGVSSIASASAIPIPATQALQPSRS